MEYLIGIDIGGTTVKVGLIDGDGIIHDKFEIKTNTDDNGMNILPDIAHSIVDYLTARDIPYSNIKGIGFGVPGPVVNNVVQTCVNLGWGKVNVEEEFNKYIPFKTKIACANDANVASIGEMWKGNEMGYSSIVMFTLGTGVGGGVVVNNKCVDGISGAGGELGHTKSDFKYNFKCNCGLKGCLETVASATGVVNVAKYLLSKPNNSTLAGMIDFSCKDVFEAAKANDELALEVVDELGKNIGYIASIVATSTNPEAFIIGGGVSKAGTILIDSITKHYKSFAFKSVSNTPFILASLGNDAGILGSAYLVK